MCCVHTRLRCVCVKNQSNETKSIPNRGSPCIFLDYYVSAPILTTAYTTWAINSMAWWGKPLHFKKINVMLSKVLYPNLLSLQFLMNEEPDIFCRHVPMRMLLSNNSPSQTPSTNLSNVFLKWFPVSKAK